MPMSRVGQKVHRRQVGGNKRWPRSLGKGKDPRKPTKMYGSGLTRIPQIFPPGHWPTLPGFRPYIGRVAKNPWILNQTCEKSSKIHQKSNFSPSKCFSPLHNVRTLPPMNTENLYLDVLCILPTFVQALCQVHLHCNKDPFPLFQLAIASTKVALSCFML